MRELVKLQEARRGLLGANLAGGGVGGGAAAAQYAGVGRPEGKGLLGGGHVIGVEVDKVGVVVSVHRRLVLLLVLVGARCLFARVTHIPDEAAETEAATVATFPVRSKAGNAHCRSAVRPRVRSARERQRCAFPFLGVDAIARGERRWRAALVIADSSAAPVHVVGAASELSWSLTASAGMVGATGERFWSQGAP